MQKKSKLNQVFKGRISAPKPAKNWLYALNSGRVKMQTQRVLSWISTTRQP